MIGGVDIEIPTRAAECSLQVAVRAMIQCWPKAVFENALKSVDAGGRKREGGR
jgi:hypothetical protein